MVKAFSYGSGDFEVASLLQFNRVDYLAVAYTDEGVELRRAGIWMPIMVMNPRPASFDALLAHTLAPDIYSFTVLYTLIENIAYRYISDYPFKLKQATGMYRLCFQPQEPDRLAQR